MEMHTSAAKPDLSKPLNKTNRLMSLSSSNLHQADICRTSLFNDIHCSENLAPSIGFSLCWQFIGDTAKHSIIFPHISNINSTIYTIICKYLLDNSTRTSLEKDGDLNFDKRFTTLQPIYTTGDGNCLAHAVSLYLWGVHDYHATVRQLIYEVLQRDKDWASCEIEKRWQNERAIQNSAVPGGGLVYNLDEWSSEWQMQVEMAKPIRRYWQPNVLPYESLDELHIFTLANIIRRPIIVVADHMHRSLDGASLAPSSFAGIYLPVLWPSSDCYSIPVVIAYHHQHFVPLVPFDSRQHRSNTAESFINAMPLVNKNGDLLKVHFLLPDEQEKLEELLYNYLELVEVRKLPDNTEQIEVLADKVQRSDSNGTGVLQQIKSVFSALWSSDTSSGGAQREQQTRRCSTSHVMLAARLHSPDNALSSDLVQCYIQTAGEQYRVHEEQRRSAEMQMYGEATAEGEDEVEQENKVEKTKGRDVESTRKQGAIPKHSTQNQHAVDTIARELASMELFGDNEISRERENLLIDLSVSGVEADSERYNPPVSQAKCASASCENVQTVSTKPYCPGCCVTCKVGGCTNRVHQVPGDLCLPHLQQELGRGAGDVTGSGHSLPPEGTSEKFCKALGCINVIYTDKGVPHAMCYECYVKWRGVTSPVEQTSPVVGRREASECLSLPAATSMACVGPQCYNRGYRELNGLCHDCFMCLKERQKQPQAFSHLKHLQQQQMQQQPIHQQQRQQEMQQQSIQQQLVQQPIQQQLVQQQPVQQQPIQQQPIQQQNELLQQPSETSGSPRSPCTNSSVCGMMAHPEYAPYCQQCFLNKTKVESAPRWPKFHPEDIPGRYVACVSGDCVGFGLPETLHLCGKCYRRYLEVISGLA